MFSNDKAKSKHSSTKDSGVTILSTGCSFIGKLVCRGSSRIAGKVEGEINSEGFLIIEEEAQVFAEVHAEDVIIHGKIEGSIHARKRVELSASAQVNCEIVTPSLFIKEGAIFNGNVIMDKNFDTKIEDIKQIHGINAAVTSRESAPSHEEDPHKVAIN